ncbi:6-phospho-3-hexuloisomerase [Candidatus Bipolaricaulota bacterium]|nr:6-phospho-3-hexuloisomerase [Candidatus Bipolaricaulota bacterium]
MTEEATQNIAAILESLSKLLSEVSREKINLLGKNIISADRIFLAGAGRSGLVLETFAMRLMHLGLDVHIAGHSTTPAARSGDLVLIASGSGETSTVSAIARQANDREVKNYLITSSFDSTIAKLADETIYIPVASTRSNRGDSKKVFQPLGSPFEQSLFILLESLVVHLMQKTGVSEKEMARRHANLE